jgi:trigger factor
MNLKVQSEKLPESMARLEIEVEPEQLNRETERAYKRLANRVVIPGFRRGKAPRVLVERALGEGALLEEATKELVPSAIADALEQEGLRPVGEPETFDILDTEPFRFEVTVPLVPTVTLGDYTSVKAERREVSVTDEQVSEVIERLREREVEWITPDPMRPAQTGDQLVIDIQDFVDTVPLGDVQQDLTIVIGEGPLMDEIDAQLVGAEEGKEYEYAAVLPENHEKDELAGKTAQFKISVKSIREKKLPELNDEFAQRVGQDVSSLEELQTGVRENLEARAAAEERERLVSDIVSQIVEQSTVEMPAMLLEREVDHQVEHMDTELRSQGVSLEQFLQFSGRTREQLREEYREPARQRLVRGLVLSEVAKAEGVEVEAADIEAEMARIQQGISEDELSNVRELLRSERWQERMRSDIYDRKLLIRVVEMATGQPLDAPIAESEDEPVQESDVEIIDTMAEMQVEQEMEEAVAVDATSEEAEKQPN